MEVLVIVVLVVIAVLVVVAIAGNSAAREAAESHARVAEMDAIANPPPTDRQLNYIDHLIAEREVEDWMLEHDPETMEEASEMIDALLEMPRRDDPD